MPAAADDGSATDAANDTAEVPCTAHVVYNVGAGVACHDIPGEQHQQSVGPDDRAIRRDCDDAVSVGAEGEPEIGFFLTNRVGQCREIRLVEWLRCAFGEVAVDFVIEGERLAAEVVVELFCDETTGAVTTVDDNLERLCDQHVIRNRIYIVHEHVRFADSTLPGSEVVIEYALV